MTRWHIITGEYPPQFGGIADYTRLVARGLAAAGDEVSIWAPGIPDSIVNDDAVRVHRLPDHFGSRGLRELSRGIDRGSRILVQYAPHAFGMKAMNLPFCVWLFNHRQSDVSVMFHEVAYPISPSQPMRLNALGVIHRVMAAMVARAAKRIFISAEGWRQRLRPYVRDSQPIRWIPVPSNIPVVSDRESIMSCRARYAPHGESIVGHFGTYGEAVSGPLRESVQSILESKDNTNLLMIGRGSEEFRASLARSHSSFASRIHATGELDSGASSISISACDVMIQPYPDGITTRNASAIAALAHAKPVVTNFGALTENLWRKSDAVAGVQGKDPRQLGAAALSVTRERARAMGCAATGLYRSVFDLRHTLRALTEN